MPGSTPTPQLRALCLFCETPATHVRKCRNGLPHHSCPEHQSNLESTVRRYANGWTL